MTTRPQPAEPTHCEWCGADYDPATRPPGRTPPAPPPAPAPAPADAEPATHCEWCGAEYPTPGRDA
jgi:hypothetical protein